MVELPSRSIVFNSRNGYLKSVINGDRNSLNTSISAEKDREQRLKCLFPYLPPPPPPQEIKVRCRWEKGVFLEVSLFLLRTRPLPERE